MREIERGNLFRRDYKRELKGKYRKTIANMLTQILTALANDQALAIKHKDHELIGNWASYRECYIKPDLLLIYKKIGSDTLRLARLGSHSELF